MRDSSSAAVALAGCSAVYYMARGSDAQVYQQKLVAAGACEAVTKTLIKYAEHEAISHASFRCLVVLLMNNTTYKTKLGALGVCGCVVESMHMFPYSAQVAKWGCRAVAVLAESHEANISRLGSAGACESIPVILQAHPGSEAVASAGCDVLSFMGEALPNGLAGRFGIAGACEAVVR
ncbi:hypothetical protein B484DRAFT_409395 [Ochromonadaceae sp. CCMP2298]|nr:hypothetical protein B484DRAFT_409395 [Ochromonadaceae sp. CCMP2298]